MKFLNIILLLLACACQNITSTDDARIKKSKTRLYAIQEIVSEKKLLIKPKIINGELANWGDVPYQIALRFPIKHIYVTYCGGSLLNPKKVLTAAHCLVEGSVPFLAPCIGRLDHIKTRLTYAVAGDLNNRNNVFREDSFEFGQWRRIGNVAFLPNYTFPRADVAVLSIRQPYVINARVKPIAMAQENKEYGGLRCLASGYGRTDRETYGVAPVLLKATLEILPTNVCSERLTIPTIPPFFLICTSNKISDVLQGDSGGPLVCTNTTDKADVNKTGVIVGIVSGNTPTGTGVSFFTRVSIYSGFIERSKALKMNYMKNYLCNVFVWILFYR